MEPLRRRYDLTTRSGRVTQLTISLEASRSVDSGANHAIDLVTHCAGDHSLNHRITIFGVDGIQATLLAVRTADARLESLRAAGHRIRWECALVGESDGVTLAAATGRDHRRFRHAMTRCLFLGHFARRAGIPRENGIASSGVFFLSDLGSLQGRE